MSAQSQRLAQSSFNGEATANNAGKGKAMKPAEGSFRNDFDDKATIDGALQLFGLSSADIEAITSRMMAYAEEYLRPALKSKWPAISGLNADQIAKINDYLTSVSDEITRWKDRIWLERFRIEVSLIDPDAFKRSCSNSH
jgi:hypothetical protein